MKENEQEPENENRWRDYSVRRAVSGLTRVALRAGSQQAGAA